jgi:hypothetical protein
MEERTMTCSKTASTIGACLLALALGTPSLRAAADEPSFQPQPRDAAADSSAKAKPEPTAADALTVQQQQIADKYKHLEEVLLRMAELTASTDPRRAALLKKAVAQSKEQLIGVQFESLVELLKKDELSRAVEGQTQVDKDLRAILELLLSENRAKRLESEKARIREYLKQVNQIIKQQKGLQGRTGGNGDPKELSKAQDKLAQKTGDVADQIKRNEESAKRDQNGEGKSGEPKPGKPDAAPGKDNDQPKPDGQDSKDKPSKPGDQGQSQGKPEKGEQGEGQPKPSEQNQGKSQGQSQGQGQGQGQGQSQDQQQPQDQSENPARKRLEEARRRMEEARKKLDEAKRQGAVEKQEEAIRQLEQAKADLEKILRQLREEEMERSLAMLEARFAKMLQMQREVYEGTVRLDKVPEADRNHNQEIEAGRLSSKEGEIVLETDKALTLLREDGTAVAFPEAIEQVRGDMEQVVQRLAQFKVNNITQAIEQDIIAALEEMLAALKKAREELQQRQQPQDQPSSGEQQDPPLVDALSEIKMIRTLQMRVNLRTERYKKMLQGEQAENSELLEALTKLAERQQRIFEITRDLTRGKNR